MPANRVLGLGETAFKLFVFNSDTLDAATGLIHGHFEQAWILIVLAAVVTANVRFWNYNSDFGEKLPRNTIRDVVEAIAQWTASNMVMFVASSAHRAIYGYFTELIPTKCCSKTPNGIGGIMKGTLSKLHIMDQRMEMVPTVRNPAIPFIITMATAVVALFLSLYLKNKKRIG